MSIQRFANNQTFISNHHKPIKPSDRRKNLWRIEIYALTSYLNISFVSRIEAFFPGSKLLFWNQKFVSNVLLQFNFESSFPSSKFCFQNPSFVSDIEVSFPESNLRFQIVVANQIIINFVSDWLFWFQFWFVSQLLLQFEIEASFLTYYSNSNLKLHFQLMTHFHFKKLFLVCSYNSSLKLR